MHFYSCLNIARTTLGLEAEVDLESKQDRYSLAGLDLVSVRSDTNSSGLAPFEALETKRSTGAI